MYELHPFERNTGITGTGAGYSEVFDKDQIAARFPLFLKDMEGYFRKRRVDPSPRDF